jgi:hypothetical protein
VNGNVVQATKSGATTTFKYDRLNRQIEQLAGSTTTQWEMDFADRRALQKEGAVETQYQWDGIRRLRRFLAPCLQEQQDTNFILRPRPA